MRRACCARHRNPPALRFKVAARSVLFAGSRRGPVEQPVCRALVERFRRHGFGFFVGCATGVDAAFRAALAHSACGPDEVFVGCAFGKRARRCRAEGLFASAVVPEGIPPRAALARRTLWLVKRSSLVVLFPERPADRQWGPGSRLVYRSALYHLKPTFVVASRPPVAPACQGVQDSRTLALHGAGTPVSVRAAHCVGRGPRTDDASVV